MEPACGADAGFSRCGGVLPQDPRRSAPGDGGGTRQAPHCHCLAGTIGGGAARRDMRQARRLWRFLGRAKGDRQAHTSGDLAAASAHGWAALCRSLRGGGMQAPCRRGRIARCGGHAAIRPGLPGRRGRRCRAAPGWPASFPTGRRAISSSSAISKQGDGAQDRLHAHGHELAGTGLAIGITTMARFAHGTACSSA